jgi:secreted PhoX family phosphatase
MSISRRQLLTGGAAFAALVSLRRMGLGEALARSAAYHPYGLLVSDPAGILDLPDGYRYTIVNRLGDTMSDGTATPPRPDGMAAFAGAGGTTILVRNHEMTVSTTADNGVRIPSTLRYDAGRGGFVRGGTTTLVVSSTNTVLGSYATLGGTVRNCAGGATPWGSWITCEETTLTPEEDARHAKRHGYCFEIPSGLQGPVDPVPLTAMGRFSHEAVCVDAATGAVYETEDVNLSSFYRFTPFRNGDLAAGGVLEAMRLVDFPRGVSTDIGFPFRVPFDVEWVKVPNPDPGRTDTPVATQAQEAGAAVIRRGEGIAWNPFDESFYFTATDGGAARSGQVFRFAPRAGAKQQGTLELVLEAAAPDSGRAVNEWEWPDNITVTPWGDLVLCKDGPGTQYLYMVTSERRVFRFARNALNGTEFAGCCFSPDGKTLFVNIYGNDTLPGLTLAITGPWRGRPRTR